MTRPLVQPTGSAHTRIYSYGAARGEIAVPNEDLIGPIDSSDEWMKNVGEMSNWSAQITTAPATPSVSA